MRSFATASGREAKAEKIDAVLCAARQVDSILGLTILDVGAGSGHIASHFAVANDVTAADIQNQLMVSSPRLRFALLSGVGLPFDDASFDVVLLNHVLAYMPDQLSALREVKRVLVPAGCCYVALPNRLFPIDPHLHLPLVNFLPRRGYAWLTNRLRHANEHLNMPTLAGIRVLFRQAGFNQVDFTPRILHSPEQFHVNMPLRLPCWSWISWVSPSNIFILRPLETS
jgi:ubiquinone/menaquinone biosynthesis C-methylase UbiE